MTAEKLESGKVIDERIKQIKDKLDTLERLPDIFLFTLSLSGYGSCIEMDGEIAADVIKGIKARLRAELLILEQEFEAL